MLSSNQCPVCKEEVNTERVYPVSPGEATVGPRKAFTYPHVGGHLIRERLEEPESPHKPKQALRTRTSVGPGSTETTVATHVVLNTQQESVTGSNV